MRNFIGVLSVCSLTACGSLSNSPSYSTDLQKWIGRSEAQLYSSWGTPEDEFIALFNIINCSIIFSYFGCENSKTET